MQFDTILNSHGYQENIRFISEVEVVQFCKPTIELSEAESDNDNRDAETALLW